MYLYRTYLSYDKVLLSTIIRFVIKGLGAER